MPKLVFDVAFWVSATLAKGGVAAFVLKLTGVALLSTLTSKLFGPKIPDVQSRLSGHSLMVRSAVEYRRIVYGQAAVSGPVAYNNTAGDNNQDLWYMIALCEGEIDEFVSLWVDSVEVVAADISWTPGASGAAGSGTGAVSTTEFSSAMFAYYGLGHPDQVALSPMVTALVDWTTNHRLRGVAYVAVNCRYNESTQSKWQAGAPTNLKAVVKGRKIYDPRLDSTRVIDDTTSPLTTGTGAHRITDNTTWAWSDNPALCVADYLYSYMGVAATAIDWISVANAADDCEVQVVVPPAASPENQEQRFTCNGVLSLGESHKDNLDKILSSMDGKLSYSGGVWTVRASVWEASTVSYDDSDLAGGLEIRGSAPKSQRSNKVRGVFVDPARDYEVTEFPPVINSTYLTRDNSKVITKDLELPLTNSATMAQRIGFRLLEQDNNQKLVKMTLNARGAKCAVGDVIDLTISKYSWSAKTFRVLEWQRNPNGTYEVTGQEEVSATYDDPIVSDYTSGNSGALTFPTESVPPPTGLTATSVPGAIRLDWTNPASEQFDYIEVYEATSSAWGGASLIAQLLADTYTVPHSGTSTYYYWVRAVRIPSTYSIRSPDSDTSTVSADPGATLGASSVYVNQYIRQAGTPSTPGATSASYNFDTDPPTFTPTSGWSVGVPAQTSPTAPCWVSTAQFYTSDGTGTDSNTTWTTPQILSQDGVDGIAGTPGAAGQDATAMNYTNNSHSVPVTNTGTEDWTGSGGNCYVFEGGTALTLNTNTQTAGYPGTDSRFNLDITAVSGDTLTEPTITGSGTTTATLGNWASNLTQVTVYRLTAYVRDSNSNQFTLQTDITLSPSFEGADGATGAAGADGDDAFAVNYTNNSHSVPVTNTGTEDWTGSGGKFYAFQGGTLLTLNSNTQAASYPGSNSRYNLNITAVSGDTLTEPTITGSGTTEGTLSVWAGNLTQATVYQIDCRIKDSGGTNIPVITEYVTLAPSFEGADGATGDTGATGAAGDDAVSVHYSNSAVAVPVTNTGTETWTGTGGTFRVFEAATALTLNTNTQTAGYPGTASRFNLNIVKVSGDTLTEPTITGSGTTTATLGNWASNLTQATLYRIDCYVTDSGSNNILFQTHVSIAPADQGADGADAGGEISPIGGDIQSAGSANQEAKYKVDSDGDVYHAAGNDDVSNTTSRGTWLNTGVASDYDCSLIKDSGTDPTTGGTLGTWYGCGSDREWSWLRSSNGITVFRGVMRWRDATTLEILGQAAIYVNIEKTL